MLFVLFRVNRHGSSSISAHKWSVSSWCFAWSRLSRYVGEFIKTWLTTKVLLLFMHCYLMHTFLNGSIYASLSYDSSFFHLGNSFYVPKYVILNLSFLNFVFDDSLLRLFKILSISSMMITVALSFGSSANLECIFRNLFISKRNYQKRHK